MITDNVSIATITWARDEKEEALLKNSLATLALLQVPVFISDGGSSEPFIRFLQSFPHFHLLPAVGNGVWAQVKNSLEAAYKYSPSFILYTEPDKKDFFENHLHQMLQDVEVDDKVGIITASRSAAGFATFPPFQQMTETTINNCIAEVMEVNVDYTYGPFLLNKALIPALQKMKEDTSWGWRPFAFATAKKLGYKVSFYKGDFTCPADQQTDTHKDRLYRMQQLHQNIQGLLLAAKE